MDTKPIDKEWHDAVVKLADDFRAENIQLKKVVEKQREIISHHKSNMRKFNSIKWLAKLNRLESELALFQSQPETQEEQKVSDEDCRSCDGNGFWWNNVEGRTARCNDCNGTGKRIKTK